MKIQLERVKAPEFKKKIEVEGLRGQLIFSFQQRIKNTYTYEGTDADSRKGSGDVYIMFHPGDERYGFRLDFCEGKQYLGGGVDDYLKVPFIMLRINCKLVWASPLTEVAADTAKAMDQMIGCIGAIVNE